MHISLENSAKMAVTGAAVGFVFGANIAGAAALGATVSLVSQVTAPFFKQMLGNYPKNSNRGLIVSILQTFGNALVTERLAFVARQVFPKIPACPGIQGVVAFTFVATFVYNVAHDLWNS